jgi:hypothetical protein
MFCEQDFEVVALDQKVFKVHKAILGQIPFFATIFECTDLGNSVAIPFSSSVVEAALEFCYTGRFSHTPSASEMLKCACYLKLDVLRSLVSQACATLPCDEKEADELLALAKMTSDASLHHIVATRFPSKNNVLPTVGEWRAWVDKEKLRLRAVQIEQVDFPTCQIRWGCYRRKTSIFNTIACVIFPTPDVPLGTQYGFHVVKENGEWVRIKYLGYVKDTSHDWVIYRRYGAPAEKPKIVIPRSLFTFVLYPDWWQEKSLPHVSQNHVTSTFNPGPTPIGIAKSITAAEGESSTA